MEPKQARDGSFPPVRIPPVLTNVQELTVQGLVVCIQYLYMEKFTSTATLKQFRLICRAVNQKVMELLPYPTMVKIPKFVSMNTQLHALQVGYFHAPLSDTSSEYREAYLKEMGQYLSRYDSLTFGVRCFLDLLKIKGTNVNHLVKKVIPNLNVETTPIEQIISHCVKLFPNLKEIDGSNHPILTERMIFEVVQNMHPQQEVKVNELKIRTTFSKYELDPGQSAHLLLSLEPSLKPLDYSLEIGPNCLYPTTKQQLAIQKAMKNFETKSNEVRKVTITSPFPIFDLQLPHSCSSFKGIVSMNPNEKLSGPPFFARNRKWDEETPYLEFLELIFIGHSTQESHRLLWDMEGEDQSPILSVKNLKFKSNLRQNFHPIRNLLPNLTVVELNFVEGQDYATAISRLYHLQSLILNEISTPAGTDVIRRVWNLVNNLGGVIFDPFDENHLNSLVKPVVSIFNSDSLRSVTLNDVIPSSFSEDVITRWDLVNNKFGFHVSLFINNYN